MKTLLLIGLTCGITSLASAISINVSTPGTLSGYYAYSLGVQLDVPENQHLDSLTISFNRVQLTSAPKGYLYVDLLDSNRSGTSAYWDGDRSGDYFASTLSAGKGIALGVQQFPNWYQTLSWSYELSADQLAALNTYAADGIFNIGLDPDCYFKTFNGSCTITYTCTDNGKRVPDGGLTAVLLGMSLLGLLAIRRRTRCNQI